MPVQTTASAGCQWFHIGELGAENGATQSDACDTCDDDETLDEHQRWWLDTNVVKDPTAEQTQAEAVDEQHFSLNTLDAFEGGGQNVLVNSGAEFGGRTPLSTLAGTVDDDVQEGAHVHGGEEAHSIVGLGIPSCSGGCHYGCACAPCVVRQPPKGAARCAAEAGETILRGLDVLPPSLLGMFYCCLVDLAFFRASLTVMVRHSGD